MSCYPASRPTHMQNLLKVWARESYWDFHKANLVHDFAQLDVGVLET